MGWQCAVIALSSISNARSFPLFASGLINPLALASVALRGSGKAPRTRRGLAALALSFLPLSWYVIAHDLTVQAGHVGWVAGLFLMLGPEVVKMSGCGNRPQQRDAVR